MRRSAAILFALVTMFGTSAPLLACLLPAHQMTAEESECCKKMADMCGSANMPQSHSCCKTTVRDNSSIVVEADPRAVPVLQAGLPVVVPMSPKASTMFLEVERHHPPSEFLPESTVLRI
jgi:hypothetical protein